MFDAFFYQDRDYRMQLMIIRVGYWKIQEVGILMDRYGKVFYPNIPFTLSGEIYFLVPDPTWNLFHAREATRCLQLRSKKMGQCLGL